MKKCCVCVFLIPFLLIGPVVLLWFGSLSVLPFHFGNYGSESLETLHLYTSIPVWILGCSYGINFRPRKLVPLIDKIT